MGKASKRERQKLNKTLREEEQAKKESRKKIIRAAQGIGLVLIIPVAILVTTLINNATDPDVYTAKITVAIDGETDLPNDGVIEVELDHAFSPNSVKHFTGFASNGLYDGLTWHRASKDFVIQGGDPNGDGTGAIGASIQAELPRRDAQPGDLMWAKSANDPAGTAGSQFFIVTASDKSDKIDALNQKVETADGTNDYQYGFLGKVIKGLENARAIEALAPKEATETSSAGDGAPTKKAVIVKIQVFKNGKLIAQGDLIPATTTSTSTSTTTTLPGVPAS